MYTITHSGADPGIYFGGPNQVLRSKFEGGARIEGAKRRSFAPENWETSLPEAEAFA